MSTFSRLGEILQVDYAAESISLSKGGRIDVLDILVTNHSQDPVDRVHIIYPQPFVGTEREGPPSISDITNTLLEDQSEFNDFYKSDGSRLSVQTGPDYAAVTIFIGDPQDILKDLPYEGEIRGDQELVIYEPSEGQASAEEWTLLAALGWSIFTLKFQTAIGNRKARWVRLKAETGPLSHNRLPFLRSTLRRIANLQTHSFEIAGPLDVRYRIRSALTAAGLAKVSGTASGKAEMIRQGLFKKLITGGIDAVGTRTVVRDWRLNVFPGNYRKCEQPQWWGDIEPCGPILNGLRRPSRVAGVTGVVEYCYQWKAGERNVPGQPKIGFFGVRIQANDLSDIPFVLPWVALLLGIVNLLLRACS